MKEQFKGVLLLLLTAIIWGVAFVAQKEGMGYVGPFTMQSTRFFLSGLVLLPFALAGRKQQAALRQKTGMRKRDVLLRGVICGVLLCFASVVQQFGLVYTSVGKSAFITALYIALVPLAGIFLRRKIAANTWIGVGIAVVGLYFLCISGGTPINIGDVLTLISAFFFTAQILYIDHVGNSVDGVQLSCIQSFTVSILAGIGMIFERPTWDALLACWLPICYAGILSGGVAYTLQILGQQRTNPTLASLLMSLEAVFAALGGWLILHQALTARELIGSALMMAAIVLTQLPFKSKAANSPS